MRDRRGDPRELAAAERLERLHVGEEAGDLLEALAVPP